MVEIKTNENPSGALDQDQMDGVSTVTSKARGVASYRRSISNPTIMT